MDNYTKEEIITNLFRFYHNDITSCQNLLKYYCLEKGKTVEQINYLLVNYNKLLVLNLLHPMLDTVCVYFETKFNITKIYYNNQLIKLY